MALEADFLNFASTSITLEPLSTMTDYGAPVYSTGDLATYSVVIDPTVRLVRTARGQEEMSVATLYVLSSSASVGLHDRVTLPDGRTPRILRVDPVHDDQGQHHIEIALGG